MPSTESKSTRRVLPPQKLVKKPGYDRSEGRPVSQLLKKRIERERRAGLLLMVPDGVPRMPIPVGAAKYNLAPGTLRKWACTGRLRYVRFGRKMLVTDADILAAAALTYEEVA